MNQKKTGLFLKELRKEQELTQEQLAEKFNVSNRTVSRWETGSNMPDLSVLVELADFYRVDIKEIIDGERKSEIMNEETRETLLKVAEYTTEDKKNQYYGMRKIIGCILMGFGTFLAISALAIFPRDSSWGSIYSILGAIILSIGVSIGNQVPRFAYEKIWSEDSITFKAPFYTAVWHNYDTENEYVEVIH